MSRQFLPLQRFLLPLLIGGLLLGGTLAMASSVQKNMASFGGIDLHSYWYYGEFVRAGVNPYAAFAAKAPLPAPVHFVDGSVVNANAVAQPHLARTPANTAPIVLLLSLTSFFPWVEAKTIWFLCNIALIAATPWLALRLLPPSLRLTSSLQWLAALSFYAMKGTRVAVVTGQTTLLVFFLMIVALLWRKEHWFWAGVALGVALSKYSLSMPVFIFLLLDKRFRVLAVALLVQALGLVAVSALQGGSLWQTVQVYWTMVILHYDLEGSVHLLASLRDYPFLAIALTVVVTLASFAMLIFTYWRGWLAADVLPINSLLLLWILLSTYHRVYDTAVSILFFIVCLSALAAWPLARYERMALAIFWVVALVFMCLPGELLDSFLPAEVATPIITWLDGSVVVTLVAMWVVNLWLAQRTPRVDAEITL